jgi:hypothetical protein
MNLLWLDQKFASLVGTQLEQFKVVKSKPYIAKFRCNVCGDSQTNKFKTRGHFYEHSGRINVKCFNCGYSASLNKFIKTYNPVLYTEYRLEYLDHKLAALLKSQSLRIESGYQAKKRISENFTVLNYTERIKKIHISLQKQGG